MNEIPAARQKTVFDPEREYLGSVYAKALLGATEKAGNTEHVLAELQTMVDELLEEQLPLLEAALASPRVPFEIKQRILERAFSGKITQETMNFLKVVCRRGRFHCLRAILQAARAQLNELRGRVEVYLTSAEPLDPPALEFVTNQLRASLGREVDLHLSISSELIGGLVVRVGDTVYDGSLANRLSRIRDEMVAKTTQTIRREVDRFAVAE